MAANVEAARHAGAPGTVAWPGPGGPLPPRPVSRQRAVILIVVALAAGTDPAAVAMVAITLAAIRGLVRDSEVIPHALTWYFGPPPAWYRRRRNRRHLRQQILDTPARLGIFMSAGNPIGRKKPGGHDDDRGWPARPRPALAGRPFQPAFRS